MCATQPWSCHLSTVAEVTTSLLGRSPVVNQGFQNVFEGVVAQKDLESPGQLKRADSTGWGADQLPEDVADSGEEAAGPSGKTDGSCGCKDVGLGCGYSIRKFSKYFEWFGKLVVYSVSPEVSNRQERAGNSQKLQQR